MSTDGSHLPNPGAEIAVAHVDTLPEERMYEMLGGLGNHEAKLAVTAIIANEPERWFAEADIYNEVKDRQGAQPGWVPDRKGPIKYCANSLGPVGLVVRGTVDSVRGETTAYQASEDSIESALALSGALMDWSLTYPDVSLQRIFGITAAKGEYRTPELRYKILKVISDYRDDRELTYSDIANQVMDERIDRFNVYANLREMGRSGILAIENIDVATDTKMQIVDPEFSHIAFDFSELQPTTRAAYNAMGILASQGRREISFNDFKTTALESDPSIDLVALRQLWSSGLSAKSENMPGLAEIERNFSDKGIFTKVQLTPEHANALQDLVTRLELLTVSSSAVAEYKQLAVQLIADPSSMAKLFAKAQRFSSNVLGQHEGSEVAQERVLSIVKSLGEVTVAAVYEEMNKQGDRRGKDAAIHLLGLLVKRGELQVERKQNDQTKKRKVNHYTAAPKPAE